MGSLVRASFGTLLGAASRAVAQLRRLVCFLAGLAATRWFMLVPGLTFLLLMLEGGRHGMDGTLIVKFVAVFWTFFGAYDGVQARRAGKPPTLAKEVQLAGTLLTAVVVFVLELRPLYEWWTLLKQTVGFSG